MGRGKLEERLQSWGGLSPFTATHAVSPVWLTLTTEVREVEWTFWLECGKAVGYLLLLWMGRKDTVHSTAVHLDCLSTLFHWPGVALWCMLGGGGSSHADTVLALLLCFRSGNLCVAGNHFDPECP